jgi:hypothetical protein
MILRLHGLKNGRCQYTEVNKKDSLKVWGGA